jgi:hypothetical protein
MLIIIGKNSFEKAVGRLAEESANRVNEELQGIRTLRDLSSKVASTREELEKLKIEKGRKEEEYARKEREIEHKVGLERTRQEHELTAGKREATLSVREENLKKDRERFEQQMKFQEERFTKEVGYLKEMLSDIVKRLPSAEFTADLTPAKRR